MRWAKLSYYQSREDVPQPPDGWGIHRIDEVYEAPPKGRLYAKSECVEGGLVPVLDQSEDGVIGFHSDAPGVVASTANPVVTFANHTCEMRWVRFPFSVIQNVFPMVGRKDVCQTRYLYYATKGRVWLEEYKGHFPDYRRAWIPLPPLPEQRRIAAVLGALDDKIELNRKMNRTLEQMAQAIFKSWFIDFDGHDPADMVESELGLIPRGWRVAKVAELAEVSGGKQLDRAEYDDVTGGYPVYGANGVMGRTNRATHAGFVIAFGRVGAYCGSIHWAPNGAWINNNASAVAPPAGAGAYVLQAILNVDWTTYRAGSAQPFISQGALSSAPVLHPPSDVLRHFDSCVAPLRAQQVHIEAQSKTLTTLRDTLLPKLISGEIRVPEAEAEVGP